MLKVRQVINFIRLFAILKRDIRCDDYMHWKPTSEAIKYPEKYTIIGVYLHSERRVHISKKLWLASLIHNFHRWGQPSVLQYRNYFRFLYSSKLWYLLWYVLIGICITSPSSFSCIHLLVVLHLRLTGWALVLVMLPNARR